MTAYLYRLGAALLLLLTLAVLWTPAQASIPTTTQYYTTSSSQMSSTLRFASPAELCEAYRAKRASENTTVTHYVKGTPAVGAAGCVSAYMNLGTEYTSSINVSTIAACPANSTLVSGACNCNAGYAQDGNKCTVQQDFDDAACKANADGLNYLGAPLVHYGSVGLTACFGGFSVTGSGAASGGGQTELYGPFKCTGAHASSCSVVPKPADIVANCATGSYPGTVNGVQVCVPPQSTVDTPKTTTATPPTPGASAPQIPDAPAGSTSQSEQTTCAGTTCTKVTTYKDASGNSMGTKTEEQSKAGYCAENPKAPGCTPDKSSFGGSCAGGFTYSGDAIQGAIAQEVYKQNCLMNAEVPESAVYDAAKTKTGDVTGNLPGNSTHNFSSSSFDTSDSIGGKACIGNVTGTVFGVTVTLPFGTYVCPIADSLRLILLALGFFFGYVILARRS